jgi:hypothetical protein
MKLGIILVFILAALGCSTSKVNLHPDDVRENIFPNGIYRHSVVLTLQPSNKSYEFNGVVKLTPEEVTIVVLSYFGTTEFRIHENLKTNEIQSEIYREQFKKFEPKLREYYSALRFILLAKNENNPTSLQAPINGKLINFELSGYDKNRIPEKLEIKSEHFSVKVKITQYEI